MSNLQARTSRSFTGVGGLLHCGSIWMLMGDYSCSTQTPPAPTTQGDTELYHGDLKEADAGSMSDRETCLQYRVGQGSRELALLLTCIPLVKGSGKRGSLNFQIAEAGEDFTKWGIFRDGVSMLLPNTADLQGMDGEKKKPYLAQGDLGDDCQKMLSYLSIKGPREGQSFDIENNSEKAHH